MKEKDKLSNMIGILDNRYILLKELGSGGTSKVYKIKDSINNKEYSLKLFHSNEKIIENEIKINKIITQFNNPFFVKYISSSTGFLLKDNTTSFEPYIIFELCTKETPILYLSYNKMGFEEKICKIFFYKILQIVKSLHKMGICHRDLKLNNFLLDGDCYNIKLGDFGFSSLITKKKNGKTKKLIGQLGTPAYMAPEIFLKKPYDGEKADIFSLGVILFNLRTSKFGFVEAKVINFAKDIREKLYNYIKGKNIETYWKILGKIFNINGLSEEFKKLYIKMISYDPNERPSIEEVYNDDWMKEIRDLNEEELKAYEIELINVLKKIEEEIIKSKDENNN